jgi:hypothetical protein
MNKLLIYHLLLKKSIHYQFLQKIIKITDISIVHLEIKCLNNNETHKNKLYSLHYSMMKEKKVLNYK